MNDGSAFPLVTLGLILIEVQPPYRHISIWFLHSVVWGIFGAIAIGWILGHFGARFMLHLRLAHQETVGTDNFLALGIMGLSFGLAEAAHTIGFIAVFVAGVAVRGIERRMDQEPPEVIEVRIADPLNEQEIAADPEKGPAFMLLRLQSFTENLERIGEAVIVILVGSLLRNSMLTGDVAIVAPLLFFVIRPVSALVGLAGSAMSWPERGMAAWFGIRGMASVYYLAYILGQGAPDALVERLSGIALGVVTYSILLHGITATPLMRWFENKSEPEPRP